MLDVDDDDELGTAGIGRGSLDPLAASSARSSALLFVPASGAVSVVSIISSLSESSTSAGSDLSSD